MVLSMLLIFAIIIFCSMFLKTIHYLCKVFLFFVLFALLIFINVAWCHEYTPSDVVQIGKIAQHEAGNQSELGKRLVIDTILNRVESGEFPNSVDEVLSQQGQYCNPKKYPPDDIYRLVAEELYFRTNDRVLWYRTKRYHTYGEPILKEGDHYFSGR